MIGMKYFKNSLLTIMTTLFFWVIISPSVYAQVPSCTDVCEATGINTTPHLATPGYPNGTDSSSHAWSNDIPNAGLPLGTHTVTWTLSSNNGNSSVHSETQSITIVDTTAPEFNLRNSQGFVTITSTGFYTPITPELLGATPKVEDIVDSEVSITLLGSLLLSNSELEDEPSHLYSEVLAKLYPDFTPIDVSDPEFENYTDTFIERDIDLFYQRVEGLLFETITDYLDEVTTGYYNVVWKAEDDSGNISYLTQGLIVVPSVSMLPSPAAVIGGKAEITIALNNKQIIDLFVNSPNLAAKSIAALGVRIELTGTVIDKINASASSPVQNPFISLEQQDDVEGTTYFLIPNDIGITPSDTLHATIVDVTDVIIARGEVLTTTISLTDQNIAPRVELTSYLEGDCGYFPLSDRTTRDAIKNVAAKCSSGEQIDGVTFSALESDRYVAVYADITDEDQTTLEWEVTGAPYEESGKRIGFLPVNATSNIVTVKLSVTDTGGLVTTKSVDILLVGAEKVPTLTDKDSDGDGTSDEDEGMDDGDGDGIADFLDSDPLNNRLPLGDENAPMFVQSGITLTLGTTKRAADGFNADNAVVSDEDLSSFGSSGKPATSSTTDVDYPAKNQISRIVDFVVEGFTPGETIRIVIPLPEEATILDNATYRKFTDADGWKSFVSNAKNSIASAALTSNNTCPDTDSTDYMSGLNKGHQCIRLSIEDGGPNDADLEVNGIIVDPGVLTVLERVNVDTTPDVTPTSTTTTTVTITTPDNSGGSTGLLILLLLPLTVFRMRKQTI